MAVNLIHNIHLRQKNKVIIPEMHVPDGLGEAEAPAVLDIIRSKVELWGESQPAPQQQRRHVELLAIMSDRVSEVDRNYAGPATPLTGGTRTLKIAPYPLP